jgi:DNA-binding CsgD family transcriptional regulator
MAACRSACDRPPWWGARRRWRCWTGLVDDSARGRGAVVVVRGEPGVGKSRLLMELVQRARTSGTPALVGRAVEGGGAFRSLADALLSHQRTCGLPPASTVAPFAGALGRLVPGWSTLQEEHPGGDLPLLISEGLLRLLRVLGGDRGLLLALDDLHWVDADTMTVLDRLTEATADLPALVLLAAREGAHPALDRLASGAEAQVLQLARLPPPEAAAMASACADGLALPAHVQQHVVEHAEGLPLLVEELQRRRSAPRSPSRSGTGLQSGQLWTAAILDRQLMACHNLRMEHPETLEVARRGVELAESLRLSVLAAGNQLFVARALGHLGQVAQMHAAIKAVEPRLRDAPEQLALLPAIRATPALVEHDLPTLSAALRDCQRMLSDANVSSPSPYRGMWALLATVLDDGVAAREELRSSGTVQSSNRAALAYAYAVDAGRAGADPTPHLELAERVMAPLTWRRHHCRLLVAPAALRDGWGSPLEWLREGAAYFEQFGDAALARACREQLRRAGAPAPRRTGGTTVPVHLRRLGVTGREAEVLALVVQGLTSAAIAERLVLSPRTVETHVANLLAKTGATSRAGLAEYVTERR